MRRLSVLFLATIISASCDSVGPSLDLGDLPATITISRGQTATVGSSSIRFAAVLNNSLCHPPGVCVWEGSVALKLTVGPTAGEGPHQELALNTNREPRAGNAMGLRLTVEELLAAPSSGDLNGQYRIRLRVEKAAVEAVH